MRRLLAAACLAVGLAWSGAAAQQTGDSNRDYTINSNGAGGTSYVLTQALVPGPFNNAYSTQDTGAPVVWATAQGSTVNWVPGLAANSVDIGPSGLTFLIDGTNSSDPLSIFASTDASGNWSLDFTASGGLASSTMDFACAHFTSSSPDGFYISQTHRVTFTSDGNLSPSSPACNPAGTVQTHVDDGFVQSPLSGWNATYYGTSYPDVFVGSNGFLTFGAGDTDFTETVAEHLSGAPRIAMWWDDLTPPNGGTVTFFDDAPNQRFEVCFTSVPEFSNTGSNDFKCTFDESAGIITLDYGPMTALDGLVGVSPGNNIDPTGTAINLSVANNAIAMGNAAYELFDGTSNVNDVTGFQVVFLLDGPGSGNNPILQL